MNKTAQLILYRLERSESTFKEACFLAEKEMWMGVVNRLYYACFYAVIALLLSDNISSKTHNGTKNLFYQNYIATGVFEKALIETYNTNFTYRNEGDYVDLVEFPPDIVKELITQTEEFIKILSDYIHKIVDNNSL